MYINKWSSNMSNLFNKIKSNKVFVPMTKREQRTFWKDNPDFVGPIAKARDPFLSKEEQLAVINKTNPMLDDYHTGIRSVDDIRTLKEAMDEVKADNLASGHPEYGYSAYPDVNDEDLEKALQEGQIMVYSSKPITNGNFVATSPMMAQEYGGMNRPPNYSRLVDPRQIAWISPEEGQVAELVNPDREGFLKQLKRKMNDAKKIEGPGNRFRALSDLMELEREYRAGH